MIPAAFDPSLPDLPLRFGVVGIVLVLTCLLMEGWAVLVYWPSVNPTLGTMV